LTGYHVTDGHEPRQIRKEAAISDAVCVVDWSRLYLWFVFFIRKFEGGCTTNPAVLPASIATRPLQISADFETALFEVCAYLPDFCVPDERDLRFASTGSNFNPRNILYIPVVEIYAFLELEQKLPFFKGLATLTLPYIVLFFINIGLALTI